MIPLHFLYSLHMLSINPLFWLVLHAVEQAHRHQDTRWLDDWEAKAFPMDHPASAGATRRPKVRSRRPVPDIGKRPTARRSPTTLSSPAVNRSPVSWLTTKASGKTLAQVVYRGRLSGPNLWLRYGFDGWQEPVQEIRLESIDSGVATSPPISLEGHITLDCVVTDGRQWDNNSGADYRLWISFNPLDAHLHVSGKGAGDLGLVSLQNALASAGVRQGIVSWLDNRMLDRIKGAATGLFPLVWVRPGDTSLEEVRTRLAAGSVGLKLHPTVHELDPYLEIAADLGRPVACHSAPGDADPDFIRRLAERFPTVPVILYHTYLGPAEGRRRAAWHVREQPNLYLETSWCGWQAVVELVETVGAERVLFGSDASVDGPHHYCRHPPNVEGRETYNQGLVPLVRALGPRAARQVLGENARRLFGLDGSSYP
jgi:predicted TIM-barrel fold metal-dependent hydrolase